MARYLLLWVHGPWVAATLMALLALRLLLAEDFSLHGHGWGLLGSAAICFRSAAFAKCRGCWRSSTAAAQRLSNSLSTWCCTERC